MKYLNRIDSPNDLKRLSIDELPVLCKEIREFLNLVVFETGGHLSSNMGVVELTVALHYVFDLLKDKVVFDVSHQCYPHKILTGRRKVFHTLRQYKGITGFTNTKESPYDNFIFGHAGTSISTALGIATAKRLKKEDGKAIAVIGDASIGAGMAFEALNHTGHMGEDLLVILNDNCMSISQTVGSFSKYLTKIRITPLYKEMRKDVAVILEKIPGIGEKLKETVERLADLVRHRLSGGDIFEELNFDYYGPIDGHDIPLLLHALETVKDRKGPILLHIITEKGKGHDGAVSDPEKYHGISPSKKKSSVVEGQTKPSISFTEAFSQAMIELAGEDEKVIGITAAMPGGTGLNSFEKVFPERYFDVGICEQHAVGMAAGQSTLGLKPVCAIYSTFLQRAYDQVFQEVCLNNNHVIFALDRAGIVGQDGATHAGVFDIAYLRTFPNIVLMAPRSSFELKEMLRFSLKLNCPVGIRFPRENCEMPFDSHGFQPVELGKAEVLKEGTDVILIGYGVMANSCLKAASILEQDGIDASVINPRFVKPLDSKLMNYLLEQGKPIITVEDHSIKGGFGSAVLELAHCNGHKSLDISVLGIPDQFVEHGSRDQILHDLGLDPESIALFVKSHILEKLNFIHAI